MNNTCKICTPQVWNSLLIKANCHVQGNLTDKKLREAVQESTKKFPISRQLQLRQGLQALFEAVDSDAQKRIGEIIEAKFPELIKQGQVSLVNFDNDERQPTKTFLVKIPETAGYAEIYTHIVEGQPKTRQITWVDNNVDATRKIMPHNLNAVIDKNSAELQKLTLVKV